MTYKNLVLTKSVYLKFSISLKNSSKLVFSSSSTQIEDSKASRSWRIFTIAKMTLFLVFCWRNRSRSMTTSITTSRSASSWWSTSWSRIWLKWKILDSISWFRSTGSSNKNALYIYLGSSASSRWVVWWFRSSSSSATAVWPGFTTGHFSWAWHFWYIKFR